VQRHVLVAAHVLADHRLGPVVHDRGGDALKVVEGATVAVPERHEILGGDEAAERVPAVGQRHVEAPHVGGPVLRLDEALVPPVDLRLGAREHLEAPVQVGRLGPQPLPGLGHVELGALVGAAEAVLGDEALVDHRGPQAAVLGQHGVDERLVVVDQLPLVGAAGGRRRRPAGGVGRQVLLHRPPVVAGLPGDLRPGGTGLSQSAIGAQIHPLLR
jgi:hypothetical protein